jgi:hypothetical protein
MMTKVLVLMVFAFVINAGCASERLYVRVVDNDGKPVSNAVVKVGFSTSNVLFGGGHSSRSKSGYAEAKTDQNGDATVKFDCKSASFGWNVEADGYYRSNLHKETFKFDEVIIPPCFGKVILKEHEKFGKEKLYKIKNPQPMYAHYPIERRKLPKTNSRIGFDLAEYDWLPPYGEGKNADFYFVCTDNKSNNKGIYEFGRIEFDADCGYYVGRQTGCEEFPATYHADTDAIYHTNIVLKCIRHEDYRVWIEPLPVIGKEEYLVLRTRVLHDQKGNIISSNFSRILGEFKVVPSVTSAEVIFNPRPNDTNLEFDPERNLSQGKTGRGMVR